MPEIKKVYLNRCCLEKKDDDDHHHGNDNHEKRFDDGDYLLAVLSPNTPPVWLQF